MSGWRLHIPLKQQSESSRIEEKAVQEFQRQQFVDLHSVVPVSFEMSAHDGFKTFAFDVGPGQRPRVEQHLSNISERASRYQTRKCNNLCLPRKRRSSRSGESR